MITQKGRERRDLLIFRPWFARFLHGISWIDGARIYFAQGFRNPWDDAKDPVYKEFWIVINYSRKWLKNKLNSSFIIHDNKLGEGWSYNFKSQLHWNRNVHGVEFKHAREECTVKTLESESRRDGVLKSFTFWDELHQVCWLSEEDLCLWLIILAAFQLSK